MTTSNEAEVKKPLSLSRGKLELKKTVDAGQVKQTFPHGRSKTVAVEVKRKRTYAPGAGGKMTEVPTDKELALATAELSAEDRAHLSNLTAGERATRLKVLEEAKRDDESPPRAGGRGSARRAEEEAEQAAPRRARRKAAEARGEVYPPVPEPAAAPVVTEEPAAAKPKAEPAVKRIEPNVVRALARPAWPRPRKRKRRRARPSVRSLRAAGQAAGAAPRRAAPAHRQDLDRPGARRERGERMRSLAAVKRAREKEKRAHHAADRGTSTRHPRRHHPRDHHRPGARQPHGRARRRRHQVADADGRHGDDQPGDRRRHRRADRHRVRPSPAPRHRVRCRDRAARRGRRSGEPGAAPAGRHRHGPCRPRQDLAARRAAPDRCRGGRGRRHHPAYRRLSGDAAQRPEDHLHRHAGPRGLHRDARARRQRHRHRRAGRRRR